METVLLLEGVNGGDYLASYDDEDDPLQLERSNKKMAGTKARRQTKRRRSLFGGSSLGGDWLENAKPIMTTGALAAGGAWISQSIINELHKMLKTETKDPWEKGSTMENLLIAGFGVILGLGVGKFGKTQKYKDYGTALGIGAMAISVLNIIGSLKEIPNNTSGLGLLTAERAPYARPAALPPLSQFPASGLYDQSAIVI